MRKVSVYLATGLLALFELACALFFLGLAVVLFALLFPLTFTRFSVQVFGAIVLVCIIGFIIRSTIHNVQESMDKWDWGNNED